MDYLNTEEVLSYFREKLLGKKYKSVRFGEGEITEVSDIIDNSGSNTGMKSDIAIKISTSEKSFAFWLSTCFARSLRFEEDMTEVLDEIDKMGVKLAEKNSEVAAQAREERRAALEEQKNQEAKRKAEQQFESQKRSVLATAKVLTESTAVEADKEFILALGYVAKHAKRITAAMPDYLEEWFIKEFGAEAEHRAVDSKKVGPAGYTSQWSLSMQIELDTNENAPKYLYRLMADTKKAVKPISDLKFIYSIVRDYGFAFGKKQSTDSIKATLPKEYIEVFDNGYAL